VRRSAFSRYPVFEPAKTQRSERMKATREKRRGMTAKGRIVSVELTMVRKFWSRCRGWKVYSIGDCRSPASGRSREKKEVEVLFEGHQRH